VREVFADFVAVPALKFGMWGGAQSGGVELGWDAGLAPGGPAPGFVATQAILGAGQGLGLLLGSEGGSDCEGKQQKAIA
jgi:hypothetical protein